MISRMPEDARQRGVVAYSSGNHAQGVALAARLLGAPAIICMPSDAPAVKVEATRGYGAEIVFYDRMRDDRAALAQRIAEGRGATLVPPYDHPHIMAGQGTAALELLEQVKDIDTLVVPVGGGGLIAGCAIAAHGVNPAIHVMSLASSRKMPTTHAVRCWQANASESPRPPPSPTDCASRPLAH